MTNSNNIEKIFSIYDKKMESFQSPFVAVNAKVAVRSLEDFLKSPNAGIIAAHPSDFALYEIGSWQAGAGIVDILREKVVDVADLIQLGDWSDNDATPKSEVE